MGASRRGDFSRFTFDPAKHYSGVLMQQGRVQLDSDWNEQADIIAHRLRTQARDFIGATGAPAGSSGFEIVPRASLAFDGKSRYLSLGHEESDLYSSPSALEIEARIRPRSAGAGGAVLCRFDKLEEGKPLQYSYMVSVLRDGRLRLNWTKPNREITTEERLDFGRWSRIVLEHDRSECRLSIDGGAATVLDQGWDRDSKGAFFLVGLAHLEGRGPRGFDGNLSEIRISGRSADSDSVSPGRRLGQLLGWWRFDTGGSDVVLDRSGRGRHAILGGGRPEARPRLELEDVLVSAGRYYSGGLLCENERTVALGDQPDLPGLELPRDRAPGRAYLFYLDVWERYLAPAQEPSLREVALGGADTAGRSQIVAQTRWLPVELDEMPADVDAPLPEWRRLVRSSRSSARIQARRGKASPGRLENRLYRVEVHASGGRYGWPRGSAPEDSSLAVESVLPAVDQVVLREGFDDSLHLQPNDWVEVFSNDTDRSAQPGVPAKVASVDFGEGIVTLAGPVERLERIAGHSAIRLRRLATFKWSRDNASLAVPIVSLEKGSRVAGLAASAQAEPGFSPGNWVEIVDDRSSLEGAPGPLYRVVGVDPDTRSLTFDHPLRNETGTDPARHPVAVRWDGVAPIRNGDWQALELGIEVRFVPGLVDRAGAAGDDRSGDHWVFAARTATGAIEWPSDAKGEPAALLPEGVEHHVSPLAVLRFDDWGFELLDTRPVFEPLATGAVSKGGDRMHGPLEIRPKASAGAGGDRIPGSDLEQEPAPSLIVSGTARADTLLGALGSPGAVETFSLADGAVTRSKISPDVGTVPVGYAILGGSPIAPPGYEYTGSSVVIPNPSPAWESRVRLEIGEQADELHSASVDGLVLTFASSGRTWSYDPGSRVFEERRPMPEPRGRFAVASAHGKVYVAGGVDHRGDRVAATLEYDPTGDEWTYRRPMPTPRSDLALVEANGNLYALGGLRDLWFLEVVSRRNEVYDPLVDHWTRRRPLPSARYALSAGSGGRRGGVFAFGGRRRWFFRWIGQAVSAINEEYLTGVDRWARRPNLLPAPRSEGAAARVGDAIFVVGGRSLFGWSSDVSSFEPRADAWEGAVPLDSPTVAPGVAAVDGRLVVHASGDAPGSLEIQECLIATTFYVHRKSPEPEGDLEPQLRIPDEAKKNLADLELPMLRTPELAAPEATAAAGGPGSSDLEESSEWAASTLEAGEDD